MTDDELLGQVHLKSEGTTTNAHSITKLLVKMASPLLAFLFLINLHVGMVDWWFGYHHLLKVAERFETSYAPNVNRQVGPDEPAWRPLLRLIRTYSTVQLPMERQPIIITRTPAPASGNIPAGPGRIAEWTAPSTPVVLLFRELTAAGLLPEDVLIVGTIGDLRAWVDRDREWVRFIVRDVILGLLTLSLIVIAWHSEGSK
jgi:hypothetical protein